MSIKESEWGAAVVLLKKNFKKPWFLETKDEADIWFNALVNEDLDYEDVISAVRILVSTKRSNDLPELPDLLDAAIDARSFRIAELFKAEEKASGEEMCKNCRNVGGTFKVYPNGSEYFEPCGCRIGRSRYPWAFKTIGQLEDDIKKMRSKGQHPSEVYIHPPKVDEKWKKQYLENTEKFHHLSKLRFSDTGKGGKLFEKRKKNTG